MSNHHAPRAQSPPRRSHDEEPTASPVTACRRCRKQKVSHIKVYYRPDEAFLDHKSSMPECDWTTVLICSCTLNSCDARKTFPLARDVKIFHPFASIRHPQTGSSWQLRDCKMQRLGLVESRRALLTSRTSANCPTMVMSLVGGNRSLLSTAPLHYLIP